MPAPVSRPAVTADAGAEVASVSLRDLARVHAKPVASVGKLARQAGLTMDIQRMFRFRSQTGERIVY